MYNSKRKILSLVWDAPKNMGDYKKFLMYKILHAADGSSNKVKCDSDTLNGLKRDLLAAICNAPL